MTSVSGVLQDGDKKGSIVCGVKEWTPPPSEAMHKSFSQGRP